jgi:hypothetical protein
LSLERSNGLRRPDAKIVVQTSAVEKRRECGGTRKMASNASVAGKVVRDLNPIGLRAGSTVEERFEHLLILRKDEENRGVCLNTLLGVPESGVNAGFTLTLKHHLNY